MSAARPIVLIGCMGAGKSAVGQALATRLSRPFIDTDAEVEARSGRSIPEIFASEGEAAFRAREREAIRWAIAQPGAVIATGGGAVCEPANWEGWQARGVVVWLRAPQAVLWERVRDQRHRPLLAGPDPQAALAGLLAAREPLYARADAVVSADRPVEAVVEAVIAAAQGAPLWVELAARRYPIYIGSGEIERLGERCRSAGAPPLLDRCLAVTDSGVPRPLVEAAVHSLRAAGFTVAVAHFAAGEAHKRLETAAALYEAALEAKLDRRSFIAAIGGGVVGDVAGFTAATYMRGIPFVQVPTTLLAQVDSSVGGKVAVDHPLAKNLIGAFHQPRLVAADVDSLRTLPRREAAAGLAELIKHGLIKDAAFFARLEGSVESLITLAPADLAPVIRWSCAIKAAVVAQDETESGERALLNYGHTVGQAIEAAAGNDAARYLHGEAVAVGMVTAALLSQRAGLLDRTATERIVRLLQAAGLPTKLEGVPIDAVLAAIDRDKKVVGGRWRFVLLDGIGRALLSDAAGVAVGPDDVARALLSQAEL